MLRGVMARDFDFEGLCSEHSFLRVPTESFFPTSFFARSIPPPFFFAVVVDSPDHTVIILRDHFSSAEGSALFRFNKDYYNLTAQVDELL